MRPAASGKNAEKKKKKPEVHLGSDGEEYSPSESESESDSDSSGEDEDSSDDDDDEDSDDEGVLTSVTDTDEMEVTDPKMRMLFKRRYRKGCAHKVIGDDDVRGKFICTNCRRVIPRPDWKVSSLEGHGTAPIGDKLTKKEKKKIASNKKVPSKVGKASKEITDDAGGRPSSPRSYDGKGDPDGGVARQQQQRYNAERAKIEKSLASGKLDEKTAHRLTARLREQQTVIGKKKKRKEGDTMEVDSPAVKKKAKKHVAASADTDADGDVVMKEAEGKGKGKEKEEEEGEEDEGEVEEEESPPVKRQIGLPEKVVELSTNRVLRSSYPNMFIRLNALWSVYTSSIVLKNNNGVMEAVSIERRAPPESKKKPVNVSMNIRSIGKYIEALQGIVRDAKPPSPVTRESILALETDEMGWRHLGPSGFTQYPHTRVVVDGTWIETREVEWTAKGGGSMEALSIIRKQSLNSGLKKDFSLDLPVYLTPALLGCLEAIEKVCFRDRSEPSE